MTFEEEAEEIRKAMLRDTGRTYEVGDRVRWQPPIHRDHPQWGEVATVVRVQRALIGWPYRIEFDSGGPMMAFGYDLIPADNAALN